MSSADPVCGNCDTVLQGPYCHGCGQRRIEAADRSMRRLLGQFFGALTDFDSRFWRSIRTLMLRPGQLSLDDLEGRRQRHVSPIALFLMANLLYFLAPAVTDFELAFIEHVPGTLRVQWLEQDRGPLDPELRARLERQGGQFHSPWTAALVERRVADRHAAAQARDPEARYQLLDYQREYDQRRGEVSRLLIVLHVPAIALMLWAFHPGARRTFAEHFVVALHLFSFLVLALELISLPSQLLMRAFEVTGAGWFKWLFLSILLLYIARAMQVVYGRSWWTSLPLAVALMFGLLVFSIMVFRTLQFLIIFALT